MTPLESSEWSEQRALKLRTLGLDFIDKYPTDSRRWDIVADFEPDSPGFVTNWGEFNAEGVATNSVVDKAKAAEWKLKVEELKAAMAKAKDVTPKLRDRLAMTEALKPFTAAMEAQEKKEPVDLPSLRTKLTAFAAKHPGEPLVQLMLIYYTGLVEEREPTNLDKEWRAFAESANTNIAKFAKAKVAFTELAKKPLDIAFTALDDRAVDLKKLRGKVVLVDFWATWCGPCVAELPNVKNVYEKFHGKGFEVVGISLEDARINPKDAPEESAAKLAKAKKALTEFIKKREMPWPQYFDGKGWENGFSKQYALSGIPAMFLLDQNGQIVTTDARGEKLEKEVKRLLKL
jgi:thiol-disulfide isomerase/thioredoxin